MGLALDLLGGPAFSILATDEMGGRPAKVQGKPDPTFIRYSSNVCASSTT
jgi:hypothetical protein